MRPLYSLCKYVKLVFETPPDQSYYYGYYTHSPLNHNNRYLLANKVEFENRDVKENDTLEVGYFDLLTSKWKSFGKTRAFNWQQGAMLQWINNGRQAKAIYNDQEGDHFVSRIIDLKNNQIQKVPHPIYTVHPLGRHALSFRFEHLYFCRAYHYEGVKDQRWNVPLHPEDGIISIDLLSGESKLLIKTVDIAALNAISDTGKDFHWLEQAIWNLTGTRIMFLHRYGHGDIYTTRLITANSDGSDLYCFPGFSSHEYTHMAWRENKNFVVYSREQKSLGKIYSSLVNSSNPLKYFSVKMYRSLIKPFLPINFTSRRVSTDGYSLVHDCSGLSKLLSKGMLREDGHPSWTKDGRFMLTDTYQDKKNYRHLLLYDAHKDKLYQLGRFFSPLNFTRYRCDLHPRFSPDDNYIIIDTAHIGHRQIFVLELDWNKYRR